MSRTMYRVQRRPKTLAHLGEWGVFRTDLDDRHNYMFVHARFEWELVSLHGSEHEAELEIRRLMIGALLEDGEEDAA